MSLHGGGAGSGGGSVFGLSRVKTAVDFTSVTWNAVGSHRLFTVTGTVRCLNYFVVTTDLTSGGAATLALGVTGSTALINAAQAYTGLTAGLLKIGGTGVYQIASTGLYVAFDNNGVANDNIIANSSKNIGLTVAGAALTGGAMDAYCFWEPISENGLVVAGTGGAL